MKKIALLLFLVLFITVLGILFSQLAECYPEHGGDEFKIFCDGSIVHFLWSSGLGMLILFFGAPLMSFVAQVNIFRSLYLRKKSLLIPYLCSFLAPLIYGILFFYAINQSREISAKVIPLWLIGVFVIGGLSVLVPQYNIDKRK